MEIFIERGQKYSEAGWKSYSWLKPADEYQQGYCMVCKVNILHTYIPSNISAHQKTKHLETPNAFQSFHNGFVCVKCANREKEAGIKLGLNIVCHSSIHSIDHTCEIIKSIWESVLGKINLHRSKCAAMIKHAASASSKELKSDMQGNKYV